MPLPTDACLPRRRATAAVTPPAGEVWSRECERNGQARPDLAPAPLRAVLPANLAMG